MQSPAASARRARDQRGRRRSGSTCEGLFHPSKSLLPVLSNEPGGIAAPSALQRQGDRIVLPGRFDNRSTSSKESVLVARGGGTERFEDGRGACGACLAHQLLVPGAVPRERLLLILHLP